MKLLDVATYVTEKIKSSCVPLENYITTDCLLSNKEGRSIAHNLPPKECNLTRFVKGDVLVSNIRPYLQKIWLADSDGGCSSDVIVFRAKDMKNSYYLFAILYQDCFYDYVMQSTKGSRMPRGDKAHIMQFDIKKLNSSSISIIVSIISILDKKIETNKRIIQNLERLSKQIYDYWFVQFDFPNKDGKPYKSSGGAMVYSEQLQKMIPKNWQVMSLKENDMFSLISTGIEYFEGNKEYLATADVQGNNIGKGNIITFENRESRANMQPKENSVWFAKMKNSIKHITIPKDSNLFIDKYILSTGFCGLKCKKETLAYVHCFINFSSFEQIKDSISHGATQQAVNETDLNHINILSPDDVILQNFDSIISPFIVKQMKLKEENIQLKSLKDYLLPKLLNGQVKVNI